MNTYSFPSVNYHLTEACNMRCNFCFATFLDLQRERQNQERALSIVKALAEAGFQKITFAGGEPTLWKGLSELLHTAKSAGMATMLVTNGSRLLDDHYYHLIKTHLDWLVLSIDSVNPSINAASGRFLRGQTPLSQLEYEQICFRAKADGLRLKVNTVVNRTNVLDNLSEFIKAVAPERWKIFQALPVEGQNSHHKGTFEVTIEEYQSYLERHRNAGLGNIMVEEDNNAIIGSYVMVSPNGRFFDDSKGQHTYSRPILEVGVKEAMKDVSINHEKFIERGGLYNW